MSDDGRINVPKTPQKPASREETPSPWQIVTEVTRRVPTARFLLVLVGVIAVAALGVGLFLGNWKVALIATFLAFILAVPALLLMSAATVVTRQGLRIIIYFMLWAFLLLTVTIFVLLITCTVWRKPRDIKDILGSSNSSPLFYISGDINTFTSAVTNKPYVLLGVTDYIDIEPGQTTGDVLCKRRISYTLLPLRQWSKRDANVFTDQYSTLYGNAYPPDHWYGNQAEKIWGDLKKPEGRAYDVKFDASDKLPKAVMTGCNALYHETDEARTPPFGWPKALAANEDFFAYPNKEDYICSYTVIVDSRGFKLNLLTALGERTGTQQNLSPVDEQDRLDTIENREKPLGLYAISASWNNLQPGDNVEIIFRFEGSTTNRVGR